MGRLEHWWNLQAELFDCGTLRGHLPVTSQYVPTQVFHPILPKVRMSRWIDDPLEFPDALDALWELTLPNNSQG